MELDVHCNLQCLELDLRALMEFASDCQFGSCQDWFLESLLNLLGEFGGVLLPCMKGVSFVVIYVESIGVDEVAVLVVFGGLCDVNWLPCGSSFWRFLN